MSRTLRTPMRALGCLLAALACGPPAQVRYEERLGETPPPAAHAVHSARFRELMRGLDRLRSNRLPQAMDVPGDREYQARQAAAQARAIAESAALIPAWAQAAGIAEEDRAAFDALAADLARQARSLAERAEALDEPALRAESASLEQTCERCHDRFRIPREPSAGDGDGS